MAYPAPSGYGGSAMATGNAQRDGITNALMSVQQPQPQTQVPQAPQMPLAGQNQPAPFPGGGMTGAMPGGPTAAQPMGGAPMPGGPAMPPVAMPGGMGPAPMPGGAPMMPGGPQQF